jgi:hypothetical protein
MRTRVFAIGLLWLPLTICVAAEEAVSDKEMMRLLARPGRLLLPEEMRGNCAGLTVTAKTHIDRLRELQKQVKKEQDGPPPSLFEDRPAVAGAAKERDRVEALNVVLDAKGCKPVDIDEELQKAPPAPMTTAAKAKKQRGGTLISH